MNQGADRQPTVTFLDDSSLDTNPNPSIFFVNDIMFTARVVTRTPGNINSTLMVTAVSDLNGAVVRCNDANLRNMELMLEVVGK